MHKLGILSSLLVLTISPILMRALNLLCVCYLTVKVLDPLSWASTVFYTSEAGGWQPQQRKAESENICI